MCVIRSWQIANTLIPAMKLAKYHILDPGAEHSY